MSIVSRPVRSLFALALAVSATGFAGLGLVGCGADEESADVDADADTDTDLVEPLTDDEDAFFNAGNEAAFPTLPGRLRRGRFIADPNNVQIIDYIEYGDQKDAVFEGDILLDPGQFEPLDQEVLAGDADADAEGTARQPAHMISNDFLWPKGIVYYAIDKSLPNKTRVTDAIKHWQARTSIRFVKRTTQPGYVYFTSGKGCSAHIGHTGSKQLVSISKACLKGQVIHEIGHAVGLWHEQQRADRDKYVTIRWSNIQKGYASAFKKADSSWSQLPTTYDLGSVMHYGSTYFSKNGKATIVRKSGARFDANREALSKKDIAGVEAVYAAAP